MPRLGSETITILRAPLVTDPVDFSEYRDWDNPTETTVNDVTAEPFLMAEKLNFEYERNREYAQTALRFYCPAGTRFESTDRIRYDGLIYEVFGHGGVWHRLNGEEHHVQVIGRRRQG